MLKKEDIADICEKLYEYCISEIPQFENGKLIWFMNGSTLCNMLYNVKYIDDVEVTKQFNDSCYSFIRQPKGDIDITYVPDRVYKFDLRNINVINFQSISEEQRTYNFVDSNSELENSDLNQLCKMTTKNGFTFYAKKPQYLFLYKFKEFLAILYKEILDGNLDEINIKRKNMLKDVKSLYNISLSYCGYDETLNTIKNLPHISEHLRIMCKNDQKCYEELLNKSINILLKNKKLSYEVLK